MQPGNQAQSIAWTSTVSPTLVAAALVALLVVVALGTLAVRFARRLPQGTPWWYYAGAAGGLSVSLNTSWRFFGDRLGVTGAERVVMFSVVELALIACAVGMRANVRHLDPATGRPGSPGAPRLVAWALCGLSGYAAVVLSGPVDGAARVALGPILSLVMLHLALGIEIRRRAGIQTGLWARVTGELRERGLSRLGLADDDRDAVTRTRERAVTRAARLALADRALWRTGRLSRALRVARVAHDPELRERLLAELAVQRSAALLAALPLRSPWEPTSATGATEQAPLAPATSAPEALPEPVEVARQLRVAPAPVARIQQHRRRTRPLAGVAAKTAAGDKTAVMRHMFDRAVKDGTVHQLTGAALARAAGATASFGRAKLAEWSGDLSEQRTEGTR
ncbi:MAG TPA: hypothetical protein VHX38_02765 [Pseudonocardiaceae bacterium]|jgi:hypothetical protein|nr:hypothetical protein [Pseudonocardiaceae bacterium]